MGIFKNKSGYSCFKEGGQTKSVHKRVCEKKMGGAVRSGYEVHHVDGNKDNNRASNLRAVRKSTHRKIHSKW
jgi:hypothetical protein